MIKKRQKYKSQKGIALVSVLLLSVLLIGLMSVASRIVLSSQKDVTRQFARQGQATNIAQAGLQDGLAWFKRQGSVVKWQTTDINQPCADSAFFPREDLATPELGDTYDESLGLVRDLKLNGNTWGRYILKRQDCSNLSDHAIHDITFLRGKNEGPLLGQGLVWALESEGIIYNRVDLTKGPSELGTNNQPLDPSNRNNILNRAKARVEITRLSLAVPKAAVTVFGGSASTFNNKCQLLGDEEAAYGIHRNTSTPGVSGTPDYTLPVSATSNYLQIDATKNVTLESVFGSSKSEIKAMSDNIYSDIDDLPDTPQPLSMTFLEGNYTFTQTKQLSGSGVLIVDGNLTLDKDSNSSYNGLIFVTGTLTVKDSNSLGGAIVAERVICTPGNSSTLEYNDNLMNNVRARIGGYRKSNLTFVVKK